MLGNGESFANRCVVGMPKNLRASRTRVRDWVMAEIDYS